MPLQLTDVQVAFLSDTQKVDALAGWIISDNTNSYSRHLRAAVSVRQSQHPSREDITAVREYLVSPQSDTGMVARLINSYLRDQSTH